MILILLYSGDTESVWAEEVIFRKKGNFLGKKSLSTNASFSVFKENSY